MGRTEDFSKSYYPCRNCGHQLGMHSVVVPADDSSCLEEECECTFSRAEGVVEDRDEYEWIIQREYSGESLLRNLEEYSTMAYTNPDLPVMRMVGAAARELRELQEADAVASAALEKVRLILKEQWKLIPQQTRQDLRAALPGGSLET